ncbi:Hypothetical predicted protein [Mytilus galloprovincialis]|uniref:Uncharacterized protein n=1 Tax=Mytilus galloprovincialis TaxID=29158 RepID=A0A8B6HN79_MYTGA|nr:Hypothetical predicted protein [Mytilus galloprovincialis]
MLIMMQQHQPYLKLSLKKKDDKNHVKKEISTSLYNISKRLKKPYMTSKNRKISPCQVTLPGGGKRNKTENMNGNEALITFDWTINFLPRKYREVQRSFCHEKRQLRTQNGEPLEDFWKSFKSYLQDNLDDSSEDKRRSISEREEKRIESNIETRQAETRQEDQAGIQI